METKRLKIFKNGTITWRNTVLSWKFGFRKGQSSIEMLNADEMLGFRYKIGKNATTCKWRGHKTIGKKFEVTVVWKNDMGLLSGSIKWKNGNKNETDGKIYYYWFSNLVNYRYSC